MSRRLGDEGSVKVVERGMVGILSLGGTQAFIFTGTEAGLSTLKPLVPTIVGLMDTSQ